MALKISIATYILDMVRIFMIFFRACHYVWWLGTP